MLLSLSFPLVGKCIPFLGHDYQHLLFTTQCVFFEAKSPVSTQCVPMFPSSEITYLGLGCTWAGGRFSLSAWQMLLPFASLSNAFAAARGAWQAGAQAGAQPARAS